MPAEAMLLALLAVLVMRWADTAVEQRGCQIERCGYKIQPVRGIDNMFWESFKSVDSAVTQYALGLSVLRVQRWP
jgi:hypothetical protein